MQIPGVDWVVAAALIAEIGVDMSVFLSVYHLSAWAGVCPGSYESAGRQKSGRARKGNVHLGTMLVGAAISAAKTKGSYLKDKFHRLKARRGGLRAALAIAHKILVSAYHMLFSRTCPIAISAKPISTRSARPEPSPTSNAASNASAIASPSNPRPSKHDPASELKLFSWQAFERRPHHPHDRPRTGRRPKPFTFQSAPNLTAVSSLGGFRTPAPPNAGTTVPRTGRRPKPFTLNARPRTGRRPKPFTKPEIQTHPPSFFA